MNSTKPPIDIIRIDKRLLTNNISTNNKRSKIESMLSLTNNKNVNDIHQVNKCSPTIMPPKSISYFPGGCVPTPPQTPKFLSIDLSPATPTVVVETSDEAMSPQLQQYCLSKSICIIRGLPSVLKLNLGLFSTKTLIETQPDHQIEVRTQRQQASDENFDFSSITTPLKNVWKCESSRSYSTIAKYGQYQAYSYHDMFKDESSEPLLPSPIHLTNGISKKNLNKNHRKYTNIGNKMEFLN